MDYALKLLKKQLRKELVVSTQCNELLRGSGLSGMHQLNINALQDRRGIANTRIIDLQEAIEKLEANHEVHHNASTEMVSKELAAGIQRLNENKEL